jgi:hypothetical protein
MAKSRGHEGERDATEEQAHEGNGEGKRRAGGRTIARWKGLAHEKHPDAGDEEIAGCISRLALDEGYDYDCDAEQVAKWRDAGTWPPAQAASDDAQQDAPPDEAAPALKDGYGIAVLRQLIRLLGKDGVKRLIDSL